MLARVLHAGLLPASFAYGLGVKIHQAWRRRLPSWGRPIPVVLVGNLTVGGTGKTPLAASLAGQCQQAGLKPAMISRGYGGVRKVDPAVVSDGNHILLSAHEAGDEPWMLAQMHPDQLVVVGADRVQAAALAVDQLGATALVFDDAFQQRHRFPAGFRVVAVNAVNPFGNGALLPAGMLREPVASLRAAHAVVLTHAAEVDASSLDQLKQRVRDLAPQAVRAAVAYELEDLESAADGGRQQREWLRGKRVLALSAIGFPEGFERMLQQATGRDVVGRAAPDHYRWQTRDLQQAARLASARGCEAMVTTAKDAARLPPAAALEVPLYIARLKLAWMEGAPELHAALTHYLTTFSR